MTAKLNYLLIIGCSQRKVKTPEPLAAIDRYDGPVYRTLRKMRRDGYTYPNLDCCIISAEYGIVIPHQMIPDYDRRMPPERADVLTEGIQAWLRHCLFTKGKGYSEVFLNLGKTYMRTLDGFHWGLIPTLEATGGIGQKTQQMKAWLERIRGQNQNALDSLDG